jgi:hypothetical protein
MCCYVYTGQFVPRELLVLGMLKVLTKGQTFSCVELVTGVSKSTMNLFFHKYLSKLTAEKFSDWIHPPSTEEELSECLVTYERLGFPGTGLSEAIPFAILLILLLLLRIKDVWVAWTALTFRGSRYHGS